MKKISLLIASALLSVFIIQGVYAEGDELAEGQIAPDFEITQMDGREFKLSDYRGKQAVYLVFWNTWCTYCIEKIPKLKEAQANLSDQIKIIAVNTGLNDSVKKSIAFQKKFKINYSLAFDHGETVTDLYGVWGTPTAFVIDINGIVRHRDGIPEELGPNLARWTQVTKENQIANTQDCTLDGVATC